MPEESVDAVTLRDALDAAVAEGRPLAVIAGEDETHALAPGGHPAEARRMAPEIEMRCATGTGILENELLQGRAAVAHDLRE